MNKKPVIHITDCSFEWSNYEEPRIAPEVRMDCATEEQKQRDEHFRKMPEISFSQFVEKCLEAFFEGPPVPRESIVVSGWRVTNITDADFPDSAPSDFMLDKIYKRINTEIDARFPDILRTT